MRVKHAFCCLQLVLFSMFFCSTHAAVDLIIFSFDRPMQLYAYLESLQKYASGLNKTFVLYRSSSGAMSNAYQKVFTSFPFVSSCKQSENDPVASFKPLLNDIFFKQSTSEYIMFGVDDIIVTDFFNVADCVAALEKTGALGFYLRLGKNITENYVRNVKNIVPPALQKVAPGVFQWAFNDALGKPSWEFKMSVDMTIFRKSDIAKMVADGQYQAPNSFEFALLRGAPKGGHGLCFEHSKMVNIPINLVQQEGPNNPSLRPALESISCRCLKSTTQHRIRKKGEWL